MPIVPADLFLSPNLTEDDAREYLAGFGFRDPGAADQHLQAIADDLPTREGMAEIAEVLLDALRTAPDPDAALVGFERYVATRTPKRMLIGYLRDDPRALGVLIDVMGTSPYLGEILIRNPEYFHWLVSQIDRSPPDAAELAEEADGLLERVETADGHADALKRFKRREMLRIAARDILGRETLEATTLQISDLADIVTERALAIAAKAVLSTSGLHALPGRFVVIGMGKLGGRELNYSSDIDLLYAYELNDEDDQSAHAVFQKLGRRLTAVMTEFTDESYLYRVDLRLRPMGRRGNIAYSLKEYGAYYNAWGETFERFALIKARPIAGDRDVGRRFLDLVRPFVYRKYLDHAALEEMFRYKARVDRSKSDGDRDVKSGRGGIREIELFTQVLQLTYGAQNASLCGPNTLASLAALERAGLVSEQLREDLSTVYLFLRAVEHRLQIVEALQTHALSSDAREMEICARRLGYADAAALAAQLNVQRTRVRDIYESILTPKPGASDFLSRQFFRMLSEEATPDEARAFLGEQLPLDPDAALDAIRALDEAASLATSRSAARNVLANLLALLVDRLRRCARPDQVLMRLEQVTVRTGAPASFFRSLLEDERLREAVVATLDLGDLPAARLIRFPELLDSVVTPLPDLDALGARYTDSLAAIPAHNRLDQIRRFKSIEEFKAVAEWGGTGDLELLQRRLSLLADRSVAQAAAWSAQVDGGEPGEWVVLALGKLGSRELTIHSDLDLVVVYRGDPADARTFVARQAFVEALEGCLEEPTDEGIAYNIDTRLRPEGKKGALAIPYEMLQRYFAERAEMWERLAWSRARVIAGSPQLAADVTAASTAFVYGPWDPAIPRYMSDVRLRMERELVEPGGRRLEFKVGRGGLVDVDFVLQMIQIREGASGEEFRVSGTLQALARLPDSTWLSAHEAVQLREAYAFLRHLETLARLDSDTPVSSAPTDPAKLETLGRRMRLDAPAGPALLKMYRDMTEGVRELFVAVTNRLSL